MPERVNYIDMTRMLAAAVERIRRETDALSTLDAATGDGDHGQAMNKIADAIADTLADRTEQDISSLLSDIGWAMMGICLMLIVPRMVFSFQLIGLWAFEVRQSP